MKVAITGHTSGIGKALAEIYAVNGHEVVGFSRSNGYDITDARCRQQIIKKLKNVDLFINNAWSGYAQCDLLYDVWEAWQGQDRSIINISSSMTMRWEQNFHDIRYRNTKRALEDAAEFLWNREPWPAVSIVAPTFTDTPMTVDQAGDNKMTAQSFAEKMYNAVHNSDCRTQILKFAVNPE